ncbi:MAG: Uma2 family endonuclease, partial [Hyphomicrobiaceae bacterium]
MTATARSRPFPRMTVADFLAWDGGGHQGKLELVDGEVRAMAPASATHGAIQSNLAVLIGGHLRGIGSRCRAVVEPAVTPRIKARHNLR